jgi:hypothetical protein
VYIYKLREVKVIASGVRVMSFTLLENDAGIEIKGLSPH